jgi:hypothetical protein
MTTRNAFVLELWNCCRTIRHELAEIRILKPDFNPKISTAIEPFPTGAWSTAYRHWLFQSREEEVE